MRKIISTLLIVLFALPTKSMADEGMWLLQLMRSQNLEEKMREHGLEISIDEIYSPDGTSLKDAIGIFGGGCTGEIVSPKGLVLTNHHCGYSFIQQLSSVEHNYLKDGFWSQNYEEELPCENIKFTFVTKITDVTDTINTRIIESRMSEEESFSRKALQKIADELFAMDDIEGKEFLRPELQPYFEGNKYYLVYYKEYPDVRLVGTPPSSVGKFGGETDNWMWPRHTGDFSVFRVYADANGNPAKYNTDNKPLDTPKHLHISIGGFEYGDYAMIMGFPGSTSRFLTGGEVRSRMYNENEPRIAMRDVALKVIRDEMEKSESVTIQYANKLARISNYWKNSIGMNKAIVDNKVIERKLENEDNFKTFAKSVGNPGYETIVEEIDVETDKFGRTQYLITLTSELISNVEFISRNLSKGELEKVNKNDNVEEHFRAVYDWLHNRDYNHGIDCRIAKEIIPLYISLTSDEERPAYINELNKKYKGDTDKMVDYIWENSVLSSKENLEKFLKKPSAKKLEKDPGMQLRESIYTTFRTLLAKNNEFMNIINPLHKIYLKGLLEMANSTPVAPDANFTMRMTYGNVKAYQPRDGVTYNHYTTLKGVMEKEDPSNSEFIVPMRLKELYQSKEYGEYAMSNGEMPVAFLTTNDITGGNSGSGVLNARGELIGLAFDGNWESLSGDITFDNNLQRCINVDIRYVLFIIEKLGNCKRLINEMTIVK